LADLQMIDTVLRNLLTNAIKFTPKGGTVTIKLEKDKAFANVSVIDSGIGMSEAEIRKLFQADNLVIKAGTSGETGSGLGLLLCKEFVERCGGKLSVHSKLHKGSTFSFTLPLA